MASSSLPGCSLGQDDLKRKGQEIKIIYGMEGYLVDDGPSVAWSVEKADLSAGFVALDVENDGSGSSQGPGHRSGTRAISARGQGGFSAGEPWVSLINPQVDIPPKLRS
jgi:DNA polymerase-3 subunit alpha (Gram-positive type)